MSETAKSGTGKSEAADLVRHLRMLRPAEGIFAFYDGRVPGQRFAAGANWVDDGALSLGVASFAILEGDHALIYDSHVSRPHAAKIRDWLEAEGARRFTVVLSHWHLDHVAGTAEFPGAEVIANARTAAHLKARQAAIEAGTESGPPAIAPLILPTRVFEGELVLQHGRREIHLIAANIHSDDATLMWLPEERLLFAGDTVEDTVTYVAEPAHLRRHAVELERIALLRPLKVLPNHGAEARIAAGGYGPEILKATRDYVLWLAGLTSAEAGALSLRQANLRALEAGALDYFAPYEEIHAQNVARVLALLR